MANLLESILGFRGQVQGYRDKARLAVMQPVLDKLADAEQTRQMNRGQEAYGKAAAALNLNAPDIGAIALLARADPQAASGLLAQAAQSRTPQGQQNLLAQQLGNQGQALGNQATAAQMGREAEAFPLEQQRRRLGIAGQQQGLQEGQLRIDQLTQPPVPPSPGAQLSQAWQDQTGTPVPSGYRVQPRFTPDGQPFLDMQPIEGTKEYNLAVDGMRGGEGAVTLIDQMLDDLATSGTEFAGATARQMRQRRDRILANYAALQNLGVLQPGEVERLDRVLPDPTTFGVQLNPAAANNIAAVYEQLREQTLEKLMLAREKFWYIPAAPILPEEQAGGR